MSSGRAFHRDERGVDHLTRGPGLTKDDVVVILRKARQLLAGEILNMATAAGKTREAALGPRLKVSSTSIHLPEA
jgi:hypothetical protein